MKVGIITQARMNSSRLPGKVLMKIKDRTILEYQIERLARVGSADTIIVAATYDSDDDAIEACCENLPAHIYRGSTEDVLGRFHGAASQHELDWIVRLTADCPLVDPEVIEDHITFVKENHRKYDYVSSVLKRTYPYGMEIELFSMEALTRAHNEAQEKRDREHVSLYIYRHPEKFRLTNLEAPGDFKKYRFTVDTQEDFEVVRFLIEKLYPRNSEFGLQDIIACLDAHPDIMMLNASVEHHIEAGQDHGK